MPSLPRALGSLLPLIAVLFCASASPQGTRDRHEDPFHSSGDIGRAQGGSTHFNTASATYEIRGGGSDVWDSADEFRFTWTPLTGDGSLDADIHFNAPVTNRLAKAMLMFRQSLDPGAPYADVAIHADGHITLQYRLAEGGETRDITLPQHNATRLHISRRGDLFSISAPTSPSSAGSVTTISVPMHESLYVGLGVCSHSVNVLQTVTFSKVSLEGTGRPEKR